MIIEEHNDGVRNTPFFYQFAGVQGGMHKDISKHLKSVHIIIQGSVSVYLAKNLHINTHYQLHMESLESFLTLLEKNNYKIMVTPQTKIQNRSVLIHLPTESCLLNESLVITLSETQIKNNFAHKFKAFSLIKSY